MENPPQVILDTTVAEITIVFPLPCKDPMSDQRKMFTFIRALNLGATKYEYYLFCCASITNKNNIFLFSAKDHPDLAMLRPASTVFPYSAVALGSLQVQPHI